MLNNADPDKESAKPGSNHYSPVVFPKLHSLMLDIPAYSASAPAEIVREYIEPLLLNKLNDLIAPLPLTMPGENIDVSTNTKRAARVIGTVLGEIISDLLCSRGSAVLEQHGKFLLDWAVQNFENLSDIERMEIALESDILAKAALSGQWEEVFEQEVEKIHVASLLAHAASTIRQCGVSYTLIRQDIEQAIEGVAQGTGELFDQFGAWHYESSPAPTDEMDAGIEKIASVKDLKRVVPTKYVFEEFSEYLGCEDEKSEFQGYIISYLPLLYGNIYLGGVYIINQKEDPELTTGQMKDLKLAAFAGAHALARVARIQNANRPTFGPGDNDSE